MDRKTLKINEETKDRLDELKRDGETWDGFLRRAADALEEDCEIEATMRRVMREELDDDYTDTISNQDK